MTQCKRNSVMIATVDVGIPPGPALFGPGVDDIEETGDVPVLVTLGDEDVPVCEDGSCAL